MPFYKTIFINNRLFFRYSASISYRNKEKKILDEILGPDRYDNRIRPTGSNSSSGLGKKQKFFVLDV